MSKISKSDLGCAVCRQALTVTVSREYHGDPMSRICGPGSRHQMTTVMRTHCETCGIQYVNGGGVEIGPKP